MIVMAVVVIIVVVIIIIIVIVVIGICITWQSAHTEIKCLSLNLEYQ